MKGLSFIILFSTVFCIASFGQRWHAPTDTLRIPPSSSQYKIAVGFFNRLDTVECKYKTSETNAVFNGYKLVYVFDGYYTDTPNTVAVFFDSRKRRIYNVSQYSVN